MSIYSDWYPTTTCTAWASNDFWKTTKAYVGPNSVSDLDNNDDYYCGRVTTNNRRGVGPNWTLGPNATVKLITTGGATSC